jgi:hypothetical protein
VVPEILVACNFFYYYSKFHISESGRFHQPYTVSAHFLYLGKVEFMEEGTPPPAYTFPSYTTYTPPHNPVITGTLINDVLTSPSPSPKSEITPPAPIPTCKLHSETPKILLTSLGM